MDFCEITPLVICRLLVLVSIWFRRRRSSHLSMSCSSSCLSALLLVSLSNTSSSLRPRSSVSRVPPWVPHSFTSETRLVHSPSHFPFCSSAHSVSTIRFPSIVLANARSVLPPLFYVFVYLPRLWRIADREPIP